MRLVPPLRPGTQRREKHGEIQLQQTERKSSSRVSSFQKRHCAPTKVQCKVSQPRYWLLARGASRQLYFSEGQETETCSLLLLKQLIWIITEAWGSKRDSCFGGALCEGVTCFYIFLFWICKSCLASHLLHNNIYFTTAAGSTITIEHRNQGKIAGIIKMERVEA